MLEHEAPVTLPTAMHEPVRPSLARTMQEKLSQRMDKLSLAMSPIILACKAVQCRTTVSSRISERPVLDSLL